MKVKDYAHEQDGRISKVVWDSHRGACEEKISPELVSWRKSLFFSRAAVASASRHEQKQNRTSSRILLSMPYVFKAYGL